MRMVALALAAAGLALTACGEDTGGATDEPTRSCPAYADVTGPEGSSAIDEFIVKFADGSDLADDRKARADLLDDVGERLCLELAESDRLATGAYLVASDRLLDEKGQATVISALERVEDVDYADINGLVHPDSDGPGSAQ